MRVRVGGRERGRGRIGRTGEELAEVVRDVAVWSWKMEITTAGSRRSTLPHPSYLPQLRHTGHLEVGRKGKNKEKATCRMGHPWHRAPGASGRAPNSRGEPLRLGNSTRTQYAVGAKSQEGQG